MTSPNTPSVVPGKSGGFSLKETGAALKTGEFVYTPCDLQNLLPKTGKYGPDNRYDLQCRTKGSSEWSTVKTGLAASSLGCEVTGLTADKWYEFRLAGYDVEENVVHSPTCEVYVYQLVPGAGTGLKSVLYGAQNVLHIATEPTVEVGIWTA